MKGLEKNVLYCKEQKLDCNNGHLKCAPFCEVKKCCKKYKRGKRCKSCPKK